VLGTGKKAYCLLINLRPPESLCTWTDRHNTSVKRATPSSTYCLPSRIFQHVTCDAARRSNYIEMRVVALAGVLGGSVPEVSSICLWLPGRPNFVP